MKLPEIQYSDGYSEHDQTSFAGLNRRRSAGDGELYDMRNLCSNDYPVLSVRPTRALVRTLLIPNGLFAWDGLAWVDGTGFYYNGALKGAVENSMKTFAGIGAYIVIMPDKKYYNVDTGEFGSMESEWTGSELTFTNGKLYDADADANTIQADGVAWSSYFKVGEAVTITGCTTHTANNKTPIIREIDGDKMYFYENIFTLDGDDGLTPYTETGSLSIKRAVPDMDFICENDNRLWGCKGNNIYASALGNIFNWNDFDGLTTDSYTVDVGSAGDFTGCVSYSSYPTFFKSDHIYRMYGNYPSNYELMTSATMGMASGSEASAAIAGETLFYLSRTGFVSYTGGIPASINEVFGTERYRNAVAGSDGLKYFASVETETGGHLLLCYDSEYGTWHIEDETEALAFAWNEDDLYMLTADGKVWAIGNRKNEYLVNEDPVEWMAETADFTESSADKKTPDKLTVRIELETGAWARAFIQYDSDGDWEPAGKKLTAGEKKTYYIPVVPHRCDHYRIRITGCGPCRIYSLTRETSTGSALKSTGRRNF